MNAFRRLMWLERDIDAAVETIDRVRAGILLLRGDGYVEAAVIHLGVPVMRGERLVVRLLLPGQRPERIGAFPGPYLPAG